MTTFLDGGMTTCLLRVRKILLVGLFGLLAALAAATPAGGANTFNATILLAADLRENPCTPTDFVNFHGTLHMVMNVTTDTRGGYHVGMEKNWVLSGESVTTGIDYRGSQTDIDSVYIGSGMTTTTVDDIQLISQASTENFLAHANTHLSVNAAGVPTATVDNVRLECSG
jgi:hypothetical protein